MSTQFSDAVLQAFHEACVQGFDATTAEITQQLYTALHALTREALFVWEYEADYPQIANALAALAKARGERA